MTRLASGAVLLAALVVTGCGATPPAIVPIEGVVLLDGKPLPHAEVQFVPMIQGFGGEYIAVGVTDEQGRFKLTCNGQSGACAGENKVTVSEGPLPDEFRGMSAKAQTGASQFLAGLKNRPIPERFANLAQSPLTITVTADRKDYDLTLTR